MLVFTYTLSQKAVQSVSECCQIISYEAAGDPLPEPTVCNAA